ncbi:Uncharacterised protein [Mycobacteroides abscessus subsp. abscessus]|nr:Uncharacterised protein [Mycobacteroides abscessus subsp. abscessus]
MNFQALSWFLDLLLMARPHDGMLNGRRPAGPFGKGAKPTFSATLDLVLSVALV